MLIHPQYISELLYHIINPYLYSVQLNLSTFCILKVRSHHVFSSVYFQPPRKLRPLKNKKPSENVRHKHFPDIRILYSPADNLFVERNVNYLAITAIVDSVK